MKVIKSNFTLLALLILPLLILSCSSDDNNRNLVAEGERFVRFSLVTDVNGVPFEFPNLPEERIELSTLDYNGVRTLKIPVVLSSTTLSETVTVGYSVETIQGNFDENILSIRPTNNQLSFSDNQFSDTIYVQVNQRILSAVGLKFNLTTVNDPSVRLGYNREQDPLNELTINFPVTEELNFNFETSSQNINGESGEQFNFSLNFPNGLIQSDDLEFFSGSSAPQFDYSIQEVSRSESKINYQFTLNENLNPDISFTEILNLNNDLELYTATAPNALLIRKDTDVEREGVVSTSFFNTSNPFFRLFGERWNYDAGDDICEWRSWNAFTVPVSVESGSEFDADEDGYHDYKVGFVSPNAPIGTNPFDIRRIINGESVRSPGLNLTEALEFFPENGNSATNGTVQVIPQLVSLVRSSDDQIFNIPIRGTGTYQLLDSGSDLWRMDFEVIYDFTSIGGPADATYQYVLFNQNGQPEPDSISADCLGTFDL